MPPPVGDLRMETFLSRPRPGGRAKRSAWAECLGQPGDCMTARQRFHKAGQSPRQCAADMNRCRRRSRSDGRMQCGFGERRGADNRKVYSHHHARSALGVASRRGAY